MVSGNWQSAKVAIRQFLDTREGEPTFKLLLETYAKYQSIVFSSKGVHTLKVTAIDPMGEESLPCFINDIVVSENIYQSKRFIYFNFFQ